MRVFLAGATGAIGRPLSYLLVAAGHEVTGTTRSRSKAEELKSRGIEPAVVDVFDSSNLMAAVIGARPDVVIHQLTGFRSGAFEGRGPSQLSLAHRGHC